jgi:hypothetical protein
MTQSLDEDEKPLDPAQAEIVRKMRRMTLLSSLIMVGGFLVVFGVIAYRMSTSAGIEAPTGPVETNIELPAGARVLSTAVSDGRLAVTVESGGVTEVHFFDIGTLQPRGKLSFRPRP